MFYTIKIFLVWFCSFIALYLLLSIVGIFLFKGTFLDIIGDGEWFLWYSILIGWWTAVFPAREYYMTVKDKFELDDDSPTANDAYYTLRNKH